MTKMLAVKLRKKGCLCETCGKVFDGLYKLAEHMRMHTGEKPFACALCLQSFSRRYHLLEHLRAHSGQRRFLCRLCGCTFAGSFALTRHERSHSNDRPHKCDLCPADFKQRHHLVEHRRLFHFNSTGHNKLLAILTADSGPCLPNVAVVKPENPSVESVLGGKSEVKTEVDLSVPLIYRGRPVSGCFAMHVTEEDVKKLPLASGDEDRVHLSNQSVLDSSSSKSEGLEGSGLSTSETNQCKFCGLQLKHRESWRNHLRKMHPNEANLKCDHCGFRTHSELTLHRHSFNCDNAEAANSEAVYNPVKHAASKLEIKTDKGCAYSLEFRRNAARLAFELKSNKLAAARLGVTARQIRRWRHRMRAGKLGLRLCNQTDGHISSGSSCVAPPPKLEVTSSEDQPTPPASFKVALPVHKSINHLSPPTNGRGSEVTSANRFQAYISGLEESDPICQAAEEVDLSLSDIAPTTIRLGTLSRPRNVVLNRCGVASRRGYGSRARRGPKQNAFCTISSSDSGGSENCLEVAFKRIFAPEDTEPDPELDSGFTKPSKRRHRFPPSSIYWPAYVLRKPFDGSPQITPLELANDDRQSCAGEIDEASEILVSVDGSDL